MLFSKKISFVLLILAFFLGALAPAAAQDGLPTAADLPLGEWSRLAPGGDTICSRGTEYAFFVRPGSADKVMVHFQGGGACWMKGNCEAGALQTFDESVDMNEADFFNQGIFDPSKPENPAQDYTTVLVSYCTGDIHTGNTTVTYGQQTPITIEHKGSVNANAVLDWLFANYPNPTNVFINGCSAGAYGAIFHAPRILAQYPEAEINHLSESGVGVLPEGWTGLDTWGFFETLDVAYPELADLTSADFSPNLLYQAAASAHPEVHFSQYSAYADPIQASFYGLQGGRREDWAAGAEAMLDELADLENFSAYTDNSEIHCLLPFPEFYTHEQSGVSILDWTTQLMAGEAPASVK